MSFGYREDFLNAYEAFWAPGVRIVRPLRNDISPLWKQDNFRMGGHNERVARSNNGLHWDAPGSRMPDDLYKTIEPGLRLASMFLDYSRHFYMKVLRAKEIQVTGINVVDRRGLLQNRRMLQCLEPAWAASQEDENAYDATIEEISSYYRLYCGEPAKTITPDMEVHGMCSHSTTPSFWIFNYICNDYFAEFATIRFRQSSAQQRSRLLFHFAQCISHELAHAFMHKRREPELVRNATQGLNLPYEPEPLFHPDDTIGELGHAWERWLFGGTPEPTSDPVDLKAFALRWCPPMPVPRPTNPLFLDFPFKEYIIHASTMARFFSTTAWEKHKLHDDAGGQAFTVELTPIRGLFGNVEDKEGDHYDRNYRRRLDAVYHARN